jgi:hypothetical protein
MDEMVERLLEEETLDYAQLEEMRARHTSLAQPSVAVEEALSVATS